MTLFSILALGPTLIAATVTQSLIIAIIGIVIGLHAVATSLPSLSIPEEIK